MPRAAPDICDSDGSGVVVAIVRMRNSEATSRRIVKSNFTIVQLALDRLYWILLCTELCTVYHTLNSG